MAAQPVAVRLDELPAKVCGSKRLHSAGCQHGHCSATVYILRNQWSACRSCRRAQSSFSCSPAQRLQRPSLCRQCAGAHRFLLSIMYGACRAAHEALMQQAVQEALTKPYWTAIKADLATSLWRALGRRGAHLSWLSYPSCRPRCAPRSAQNFGIVLHPCWRRYAGGSQRLAVAPCARGHREKY